jgi:hypothetical protein
MMRKSKYKSKIIKQRKARIFGEIDKAFVELRQALTLSKNQMSAEMEHLISVSPDYAAINHFCLKVIPLYEDFLLNAVAFDAANKRLLYTFDSDADWSRVKVFYSDWFSKQGGKIIDESDKLPPLDKIAVKTDNYKITLCDTSIISGYLLIGEKD